MNRRARVLVASNNAHKLQELREIFATAEAPVELVAPREIGIELEPAETADTYLGNAQLKARAFTQQLRDMPGDGAIGMWVLADDSGLEVDALDGKPGIFSSRYHKQSPGGDGCAQLLRALDGVSDERRTARFRAVIALVGPDGAEHAFDGACEGRIGHEKHGSGGFGFDPVFVVGGVGGDGRMMAELSAAEKHLISHRGIAARRAAEFLSRHAEG